ncbi:N-acetyltransferase [Fibrisoma montanum]|uniref:N-acetyltransferase n=1 Tax=Fibrisoma montanum TaxID=2305895 RepID=A0A418M8W1_9BACT|nr:GNAT family N-acetyltransferase [Fibrisoma montanum]RIV22529.1 N-acetyltransferase [Fibrisoma montanum]
MFFLETTRLRLIPLTSQHLSLWLRSRTLLERILGLTPEPYDLEPEYYTEVVDALQNYWLPNTERYPSQYMWFTNWEIVPKDQNRSVGGIGLAGLPNDAGETMVGYSLLRKYRRQGYATEAMQGLLNWAFENPNLQTVIADTHIDNQASQGVLIKNGFIKIREIDEIVRWHHQRI